VTNNKKVIGFTNNEDINKNIIIIKTTLNKENGILSIKKSVKSKLNSRNKTTLIKYTIRYSKKIT